MEPSNIHLLARLAARVLRLGLKMRANKVDFHRNVEVRFLVFPWFNGYPLKALD